MNQTEKDLINEKFTNVFNMLDQHKELELEREKTLNEKLDKILIQTTKTNGRVTAIETICIPEIKKSVSFFTWFSAKPIRLILFFLIPMMLGYILSVDGIWKIIEKIVTLF